jgi:hypothetical protein
MKEAYDKSFLYCKYLEIVLKSLKKRGDVVGEYA